MKKKIQKPFDIEAAKNGAVVETKEGNSVRILCYDKADGYPIIALVNVGDSAACRSYTSEGELLRNSSDGHDLVIIEEVDYPKFNVGNWVVNMFDWGYPWYITAVNSVYYELQNTQGVKIGADQITIDNYFRLWTLKDAKPGDILTYGNDNRPFIFSGLYYDDAPVAYCGIDSIDSITVDTGRAWTYKPVRPATYKERQQFFNRLEEEGYKWDTESLTLSKIQKRWRDKKAEVNGYYIHSNSHIMAHSGYNTFINYNIFTTKKQAKAALAMARISQIMKNDERFGGVVTNEEWNYGPWSVILRKDTTLETSIRQCYEYLAFHTDDQAKLFLKENEDLVKDYYMMD